MAITSVDLNKLGSVVVKTITSDKLKLEILDRAVDTHSVTAMPFPSVPQSTSPFAINSY